MFDGANHRNRQVQFIRLENSVGLKWINKRALRAFSDSRFREYVAIQVNKKTKHNNNRF